jgi:ElaB/YqjD/DUF883 family membrane-anchored ribosome-binding protein
MSNQATKEATTNEGFLKETLNTAAQVAQAGLKVEELKTQASHALEDGIEEAKRMAKRGRYAAEDFIEDTAHRIKQDPLRSAGVTLGVGFALGAIVGLLIASKTKA